MELKDLDHIERLRKCEEVWRVRLKTVFKFQNENESFCYLNNAITIENCITMSTKKLIYTAIITDILMRHAKVCLELNECGVNIDRELQLKPIMEKNL